MHDHPSGLARRRRPLRALLALLATALLVLGCATLDEQQRRWIFQPATGTWGHGATDLQDVWIDFRSPATGEAVQLHGLWHPQPRADAPVLLYLHGARWNVASSAGRMRRMHALGFSVLGVDYRGFGRSTQALPSEDMAHEDAAAAWAWLATRHPQAPRYLYGHSLGSAIAVRLAAEQVPAGLILEGSFTSMPDLVSTFRYGWLPVGPLITQRFDAAGRIGTLKTPVLMVHGEQDQLIPARLGRALFDLAPEPKRFILVAGGTHHNAGGVGLEAVRDGMTELFGLSVPR